MHSLETTVFISLKLVRIVDMKLPNMSQRSLLLHHIMVLRTEKLIHLPYQTYRIVELKHQSVTVLLPINAQKHRPPIIRKPDITQFIMK